MKIKNLALLALCLFIPLLIGFIGSWFTTPAIDTWYVSLAKPSFNPPNWIFGPVWTFLFILMGLALFLIVRRKKFNRPAVLVFALQLLLNLLWSFLFFGLHSPLLAFGEIILLWLAILATIIIFYQQRPLSAYLLLPYLAWVSFAAFLNFSIWRIN